MSGLSDLIRTAGNALLSPVALGDLPGARAWRRALLVGSGDRALLEQAQADLRRAAPDVSVEDACGSGLWALRRRGYDVACLLLTGEGRRREKALGAFSGARVVLAYGPGRGWYRVHLPAFRPSSGRWWARALLAKLLCIGYTFVMLAIAATDALRRAIPMPRPVSDPGPPVGWETTFIVPTYNQRHLMDFCLPALVREAGQRHAVLVVDDASTDGTYEYVRRRYPGVTAVRLPANRGFAGAVRAGIAASRTPLFALINTDVQIRAGFLEAILPHFREADTFAVCCRIELPGGSQMETGNAAGDFSGILEPHFVPPTGPGPILYATGACSVFHRARYEALGGLETIYRPLYWEDTELGYRAWRRGWRSVFEPRASALHRRRMWIGARFGNAYADETFLRNAILFVWKNVRDPGLLARHLVYTWAVLARETDGESRMMTRAVIRALPLLPAVLLRRWREWRRGDLGDREILALSRPPAAGDPAEAVRA
jgi:GT2 family glycosyltransferase